jgi:hypothetical protein
MFTRLTNRDVINDIKVYRTAVCIAQALVFSKAVIGTVEAKDRKVRTPTLQPAKMLQDARMSAMTGRTAAS